MMNMYVCIYYVFALCMYRMNHSMCMFQLAILYLVFHAFPYNMMQGLFKATMYLVIIWVGGWGVHVCFVHAHMHVYMCVTVCACVYICVCYCVHVCVCVCVCVFQHSINGLITNG